MLPSSPLGGCVCASYIEGSDVRVGAGKRKNSLRFFVISPYLTISRARKIFTIAGARFSYVSCYCGNEEEYHAQSKS